MTPATSRDERAQDTRAFLGMNTVSARWTAAAFFVTYSLMAFSSTTGVGNIWIVEGAVLLVCAASFALVALPGDPLSVRAAAAIAAAGPIATALVLWQLPVPVFNQLQTWPLSAAIALFTFVCVRGRIVVAWIAMTSTVAVCVAWAAWTGQGPVAGLSMSVINYAPLAMATFFALTFRPVAKAVFALRNQSRRRAAENAATSAILEERDLQLERLDFLARPLLDKIASGAPLDEDERIACGLLEASLRDDLRAKGLSNDDVGMAARSARRRGVHVVLLDDGGLATAVPGADAAVRTAVADTLDSVVHGVVTARILPPGRSALASILVRESEADVRIELGIDGSVRTEKIDRAPN